MNSSLNLFTQSDILHQIGAGPLHRFVSHFINSDARLASLDPDSPYLCSELARLFTQPQSLSPRLCETLVLLETAALPEHQDRLAALAQQRLPDLCVTEFHPIALALELWLACPDDLYLFASQSAENCRRRREETPSVPASPIDLASVPPIQRSINPSIQPSGIPSIEPSETENQDGTTSLVGRTDSVNGRTSLVSQIENEDGRTSLVTGSVSKIENSVHPVTQQSINPPIQSQDSATPPLHHSHPCILELLRSLVTRYVILPEHAAEALALWIVHTYAFELRDVTTYLALESPVRRCGKSTLLNILSRLVNRPLVAANVSPSALYRAIEELRPTLMIDEADTFLKPNDELLGILNAGYHRATAYVLRVARERSSCRRRGNETPSSPDYPVPVGRSSRGDEAPSSNNSKIENQNSKMENSPDRVGPDHPPFTNYKSRLERFSCWCPKIIARIGRLPDTLADRCIVIRMQRKTPNDQCERFRDFDMVAVREDLSQDVRKDLSQECAQFVQDHRDAIISAKPKIPAALNDRAADIWEPLLAIADCAGGDWPARAREAAVALSSDTRENNPVGSLLLDIFLLFATSGQDRITTRALVEALNTQFTDRPWMETRKGQRSTEMWLAQQLRPFGITPRTFRNDNTLAKGYLRDDFTEAFRRYIPASELDALRAVAEKHTQSESPIGTT